MTNEGVKILPIKIPNDLPASKILKDENIFVMDENRALTQQIRPLKLLILNIFVQKILTNVYACDNIQIIAFINIVKW